MKSTDPQRDLLAAGTPVGHDAASLPSRELITKYGRPGPRYTSYPAVPYWPAGYNPASYEEALAGLGRRSATNPDEAVSIYVHVPFCERRCLFCGCNVVVSRAHERGRRYIDMLRREMDMALRAVHSGSPGVRPRVRQMHWGGGTPTWLSAEELTELCGVIAERFEMLPDREQSIEVDPRVTTPEQLEALRACGLNRVSMGVQDIDEHVQDAISRHQTVEQTKAVIDRARELGINGITVDIVYGLPFQTIDSFERTIRTVIGLGVDRVAVYNFAYLPDRLKHQRVIKPETLPSADTRVELFRTAADRFTAAGYDMIGMDHFARHDDELSIAQRDGTMQRNFMGYTTRAGCDLLAFGVSAISRVGRDFAQNAKTTVEYGLRIDAGASPVVHGMRLSDEDAQREAIIQSVMCYGEVSLATPPATSTPTPTTTPTTTSTAGGVDPLSSERTLAGLAELERDGLVTWGDGGREGRRLRVTPRGRYFLRNIAMTFDPYLASPPPPETSSTGQVVQIKFSRTV